MPTRDVSSVGLEHYFDRVGVTGSSPVRPTSDGRCSMADGRGFGRGPKYIRQKLRRKSRLIWRLWYVRTLPLTDNGQQTTHSFGHLPKPRDIGHRPSSIGHRPTTSTPPPHSPILSAAAWLREYSCRYSLRSCRLCRVFQIIPSGFDRYAVR